MRVISENLDRIIPSKDVRNLLVSGVTLSDSVFATIIFNHEILSFEEIRQMLASLAQETTDQKLADEIKQRLSIQEGQYRDLDYWELIGGEDYNRRFESQYIDLPNPFEKGDVIRNMVNGDTYVVMTSQEQWTEFDKRRVALDGYVDYSDASVVIVPMEEYKKYGAEGFVDHEHVNPIYLERIVP